ncbi:hypothetical protein [Snuella lapsa]|uniref:Uncharacterized protein n=1 Tax=Snuella lapsa TaxID=870481 RepID=A0ABP6XAF0_9FLAO
MNLEAKAHYLARFLLINTETVQDNGIKGKIPLLYFFFKYSRIYSKELYTEFAFEILEDILITELHTIENDIEKNNPKIAEIGWALMQFIEKGYFESDDLDNILAIMDKSVFREVKMLNKQDVLINHLPQLIVLGLYLVLRLRVAGSEMKQVEAKASLSKIFVLLIEMDLALVKDAGLFGLYRSFIKSVISDKAVVKFSKTEAKSLNDLNIVNNEGFMANDHKNPLEEQKFDDITTNDLFFPNLIEETTQANQGEKKYFQNLMMYAIRLLNQGLEIKTNSNEFYMLTFLQDMVNHE